MLPSQRPLTYFCTTLNLLLSYGCAVREKMTMPKLLSLFRSRKQRRTTRLLALLAEEPAAYKVVGDLAHSSQLGSVVYPLLADLSRQGLVEHRWVAIDEETRLVYRLTPKGLERLS